jgi:MYXO-CTERM domain-containing protein
VPTATATIPGPTALQEVTLSSGSGGSSAPLAFLALGTLALLGLTLYRRRTR